MNGVITGGVGLVAVGFYESGNDRDAAVWTSMDGITWSRAPHDDAVFGGDGWQEVRSVTSGGPGLVAIGSSFSAVGVAAAVWTSTDGITWSRVPHNEAVLGGDGQPGMSSVTAGGPGLVAVGFDDAGGDMDAAVWTSPDGITWSRVIPDEVVFGGVGRQEMWSVTLGEPGLVAVGFDDGGGDTDAAVWTSPDGITWSRVPHDEAVLGGVDGQFMTGVTAGGPGVVAVGFAESLSAAVWVLAGED